VGTCISSITVQDAVELQKGLYSALQARLNDDPILIKVFFGYLFVLLFRTGSITPQVPRLDSSLGFCELSSLLFNL
jgi:hypothetical protein